MGPPSRADRWREIAAHDAPIVFVFVPDPVATSLWLASPGGNIPPVSITPLLAATTIGRCSKMSKGAILPLKLSKSGECRFKRDHDDLIRSRCAAYRYPS